MADPVRLPAPAYVYVIGAPDGPQKIGVAADAASRCAMLQTGNPVALAIAHAVPIARDDAFAVERRAHALLSSDRIRGEWFDVTPAEAIAAVDEAHRACLAGDLDPPATREGNAWQARLRRAGLSQADLARLAGRRENAISEGLASKGKGGVPIYLRSLIRLWELSDRKGRERVLAEPEVEADQE